MDKHTVAEVIKRIVTERGIIILNNPSMFCAMMDDYIPDLSRERKILRKTLTPDVSAKIVELYHCKGSVQTSFSLLKEYLKSECGLSGEWSDFFLSVFSEAFDIDDQTIIQVTELNARSKRCLPDYTEDSSETLNPRLIPTQVPGSNNTLNGDLRKTQPAIRSNCIVDPNLAALLSKKISAGFSHFVAVCEDGHVIARGDNSNGQCNTSGWSNIIKVDAGSFHSIGLKHDGTVCATYYSAYSDSGQSDIASWKNIIDIAAGYNYSMGLKVDGTVIATGTNQLTKQTQQCLVDSWSHIVAISAHASTAVGLRDDGTVLCTDSILQAQIKEWRDIVFITAGANHCIGLDKKGKVFVALNTSVTQNRGQGDVSLFRDIIMVSCSFDQTVGIKRNGNVVSTQLRPEYREPRREPRFSDFGQRIQYYRYQDPYKRIDFGQYRAEYWNNIIAVTAGNHFVVGLQYDGKLKADGNNEFGQCDVNDCRLFYDSETFFKGLKKQNNELNDMMQHRAFKSVSIKSESKHGSGRFYDSKYFNSEFSRTIWKPLK